MATPNTELSERADRNIEDAFYIRNRFIPAALDDSRWNVAAFESYAVVELVLKGMICRLGIAPCRTHNISVLWAQVDTELASPERLSSHLPAYVALVTPDHDSYGGGFYGGLWHLSKNVHGTRTVLAVEDGPGAYDLEDLLDVRLECNNYVVSLYVGGRLVSQQTDATLAGSLSLERSFSLQPSQARVQNLKRLGAKLLEGRAPAFYSETVYDEKAARQAAEMMEECLQMLKEMVIRSEVT